MVGRGFEILHLWNLWSDHIAKNQRVYTSGSVFKESVDKSEGCKSFSNSKRKNRTLVLLQRHDVEIMFLVFVIELSRTIKMAGLLFAPGQTLTS